MPVTEKLLSDRPTLMDSEKPPSLRSRIIQIFAGFIGLLMLYVLSLGPAWYLGVHFHSDLFMKPYEPLFWATQGTPVRDALNVYATWWDDLPGGNQHLD